MTHSAFIIIKMTLGGSKVPGFPNDITDIGHMAEWNGIAAFEPWPE